MGAKCEGDSGANRAQAEQRTKTQSALLPRLWFMSGADSHNQHGTLKRCLTLHEIHVYLAVDIERALARERLRLIVEWYP